MLKHIRKFLNTVQDTISELIAGVTILVGLAIVSVLSVIVTAVAFLFVHPVGWLILLILILKHC